MKKNIKRKVKKELTDQEKNNENIKWFFQGLMKGTIKINYIGGK
jgi:hypothetical protein